MNQTDPAWGPRPPKSAVRLWSRYVFQWLWGVLYGIGWILAPVLGAILEAVDTASGGSRIRPSRRIWLSRERLRRERRTDPGEVEALLRERLTSLTAADGRPAGTPRTIQVDDSYFRQIGATRALQIAQEYGWHLPAEAARYAPTWLVLRRLAEPSGQRRRPQPLQEETPLGAPEPVTTAVPYTPIPAVRHSIAGEMGESIRLWASGGQAGPVARIGVERTRSGKADKTFRTPFTLWGGSDGGLLCSVLPVGRGTYDVTAADGTPLARVTRRPGRLLLGPRRVRWTVEPATAAGPVTGKVGTWYSWLTYYMTFPLWALLWLCVAVYSFINGEGDDIHVTGPSRTRWRGPGTGTSTGTGTAMEYRGLNKVYHLDPRHLDVRVAYAQAYLHARDR